MKAEPVAKGKPSPTDITTESPAPEQLNAAVGAESAWRSAEEIHQKYIQLLSIVEQERHYYQDLLDLLPTGVVVFAVGATEVYSNQAFRGLVREISGLLESVRDAMGRAIEQPEPRFQSGAGGSDGAFRITVLPTRRGSAAGSTETVVFVDRVPAPAAATPRPIPEPAGALASDSAAREESAPPSPPGFETDTVVIPARKDGFDRMFVGEKRWYAVRISESMRPQVKYIAAYQVAPISAITHIAPVKSIGPWKKTSRFAVLFSEPAQTIKPIGILPKGRIKGLASFRYTSKAKLESAESLDDVW